MLKITDHSETNSNSNKNANSNNNNNSSNSASVAAPISIGYDLLKLENYLTPEIRNSLSLVMFPNAPAPQKEFMKMGAADAVRLMYQEMYFNDKKQRDQLIEWLEKITSARMFVQYLRTGLEPRTLTMINRDEKPKSEDAPNPGKQEQ